MTGIDIREFLRSRHARSTLTLDNPASLDVLADARQIEVLHLSHFPRIHSLEPLRKLTRLRELHLETQIGWDGTNRHLRVDSFAPLAALKRLETLTILGVVPATGRLEPLHGLRQLRSVTVGQTNYYQVDDFVALAVALPRARASLQPVRQMAFIIRCRRCRKWPLLYLVGAKPKAPRYACPACGQKQIVAHLERWNAAGGRPRYADPSALTPADMLERFGNPEAR